MKTTQPSDPFEARANLQIRGGDVLIYRLDALTRGGIGRIDRLPFSIRVLLESALRNVGRSGVTEEHVRHLANWNPKSPGASEIPFIPARVILQDFTGVPAIVDLAAMRDAIVKLGGDPKKINPQLPADLVIDHSVQVDSFGSPDSLGINARMEFQRNRERYEFLHWGKTAFANFRVIPPATGIVHQVNLEYLATVVATRQLDGKTVALPDSLVGTDSHTTMINGLGVLGWGVGGIEAEAAMLGQPIYMVIPKVVGLRLCGQIGEGTTATDLVLTVTQILRKHGVVGKFVEFFGEGLSSMSLPDRATLANMSPEYGATIGFFPVDAETLAYLRRSARSEQLVDLVERYTKEQGLFRTDDTPDPEFTEMLELDLSAVEPSLAGPKRPQDLVLLSAMKSEFQRSLRASLNQRGFALNEEQLTSAATIEENGGSQTLRHGTVVIAAITSCTNTSNPSVMVGAGILAKHATERGLSVKPYVKTSLAPGSPVVTEYLNNAGLTPYLEKLGFHTVGYGCTTCIGNSGPLPDAVQQAVKDADLVAAAVLSGNRNFEGRINPSVRASYLASPPLVVAFAIAGRVDIDMSTDPLGQAKDGTPVYLKDIWPTHAEISEAISKSITPDQFKRRYDDAVAGNDMWNAIESSGGDTYDWRDDNSYIQNPPFFADISPTPPGIGDVTGACVLVMVGDSVTTDHISPAGPIASDSPAGEYLRSLGIEPKDFNTYGSRRGNDRVMTRGTFANIRLRNLLAPGTEGGVTIHLPTGEQTTIYEAALRYREEATPLIVLAGAEYGMGSSRDWAAKGTMLLGIRAVIAVSFERIHRSNLIGMGVLPLQFADGDHRESLGLTGKETFDIVGLDEHLQPGRKLAVTATDPDGAKKTFNVICRIDTPVEVEYYRNGGILPLVLRSLTKD